MVKLSDLLHLGITLWPELHIRGAQATAVPERDARYGYGDGAKRVPEYASNVKRLHETVKRARSVVERRDASVAVPVSELHVILTKIESMEKQIKAWMDKGGDKDGAADGSSEVHGVNSPDKDCDAENLLYDLGVKAALDERGQVSGHPFFRRNANCPMGSAADRKKGNGPVGGLHGGAAAKGHGVSGDSRSPAPYDYPPPPLARTTPAAIAGDATHKTAANGDYIPIPWPAVGRDDTLPPWPSLTGAPATGAQATGVPPEDTMQVVAGTEESVEVHLIHSDGHLLTTTITKTSVRMETVTVKKPAKPTKDATRNDKRPAKPTVTGFRYTNSTTSLGTKTAAPAAAANAPPHGALHNGTVSEGAGAAGNKTARPVKPDANTGHKNPAQVLDLLNNIFGHHGTEDAAQPTVPAQAAAMATQKAPVNSPARIINTPSAVNYNSTMVHKNSTLEHENSTPAHKNSTLEHKTTGAGARPQPLPSKPTESVQTIEVIPIAAKPSNASAAALGGTATGKPTILPSAANHNGTKSFRTVWTVGHRAL